MPDTVYSLLQIAIMAAVTALLRFLPFFVFPEGRKRPAFVAYLSRVLPCAIMGMLVVYCLKNISFVAAPHGLPEFISIAVVVLLHLWKHNSLLSIFAGTAFYMFLMQVVF